MQRVHKDHYIKYYRQEKLLSTKFMAKLDL